MKSKINITIDMPSQSPDEYKYRDLVEKCRDYMLVCQSDNDSDYHYRYLAAVYKKLTSGCKVPEHLLPLLEELEEFMLKYNMDRHHLDAATMFRHYHDDED